MILPFVSHSRAPFSSPRPFARSPRFIHELGRFRLSVYTHCCNFVTPLWTRHQSFSNPIVDLFSLVADIFNFHTQLHTVHRIVLAILAQISPFLRTPLCCIPHTLMTPLTNLPNRPSSQIYCSFSLSDTSSPCILSGSGWGPSRAEKGHPDKTLPALTTNNHINTHSLSNILARHSSAAAPSMLSVCDHSPSSPKISSSEALCWGFPSLCCCCCLTEPHQIKKSH